MEIDPIFNLTKQIKEIKEERKFIRFSLALIMVIAIGSLYCNDQYVRFAVDRFLQQDKEWLFRALKIHQEEVGRTNANIERTNAYVGNVEAHGAFLSDVLKQCMLHSAREE